MSNLDELKPCPFCGGTNVAIFGPYGLNRRYGISHSCLTFYSGASDFAKGFPTKESALVAWNTRILSRTDG